MTKELEKALEVFKRARDASKHRQRTPSPKKKKKKKSVTFTHLHAAAESRSAEAGARPAHDFNVANRRQRRARGGARASEYNDIVMVNTLPTSI